MTQKENDRMPFSLRECKDRKKGSGITMRLRNIFSVRLLAPASSLPLPFWPCDRLLMLGGTPSWVLVVAW